MEESEALHTLSIQDELKYAGLIQSTLLEGGIDCELTQVRTGDDFVAALGKGGFDLILSDYWLPSFDALLVLKMAREAYPEVPFILVSGAIGEESDRSPEEWRYGLRAEALLGTDCAESAARDTRSQGARPTQMGQESDWSE